MQLWFSRGSDISIRDQLRTQVILGILSGELEPGQRLPSTRQLARRFHLHPNTVSAGYRRLQHEKWVEFRKGSGVYVRRQDSARPPSALALDQLITDFFLFVFNDTATTEIYTLSLHDALPIPPRRRGPGTATRRTPPRCLPWRTARDRKSTRLNSSHVEISYAVFCLKKKK